MFELAAGAPGNKAGDGGHGMIVGAGGRQAKAECGRMVASCRHQASRRSRASATDRNHEAVRHSSRRRIPARSCRPSAASADLLPGLAGRVSAPRRTPGSSLSAQSRAPLAYGRPARPGAGSIVCRTTGPRRSAYPIPRCASSSLAGQRGSARRACAAAPPA